jgi:indolepyruvate ferredoxin oxidoreductase alpha subunit
MLGFSYPMPEKMIKKFASQVRKLIVIEELDPFIEEYVKSLCIDVAGKDFVPIIGELNQDIIRKGAVRAGLLSGGEEEKTQYQVPKLPGRLPLLCPGCPHTGIFYTLSVLGHRSAVPGKKPGEPKLIINGDIGCYTLGALPPLSAMDTCGCMGASIGNAIGMQKAGVDEKLIAVIGDSTFLHSGITGLIDAVYNKAKITLIILDNRTTAMTGHQEHPGTGKTAQGEDTAAVSLEAIVRASGVGNIQTVDAWDLKSLKNNLKASMDSGELSVIIVRGACAVNVKKGINPAVVDADKCTACGLCLTLGCSAIQKNGDAITIDGSLCAGDSCRLCRQVCPNKAISTAVIQPGGWNSERVQSDNSRCRRAGRDTCREYYRQGGHSFRLRCKENRYHRYGAARRQRHQPSAHSSEDIFSGYRRGGSGYRSFLRKNGGRSLYQFSEARRYRYNE